LLETNTSLIRKSVNYGQFFVTLAPWLPFIILFCAGVPYLEDDYDFSAHHHVAKVPLT
jgi:hypothetical protein